MPTSGRVARAAGLLAGVLASTLVFLLLGEILARAIGLIDRLNVHPRELYIATDVPDLPYRLRPGFVGRPLAHREDVRINRSGTRGPELATAETATRVLVVGDSVVFGHMLDEGETFPAQLQQEMDARGADVEIVNAGINGYNTRTELLFTQHYLLGLKPQMVLLGVSLNDYGRTPTLTKLGVLNQVQELEGGLPWLSDHSHFYLLLRWMAHRLGRSTDPPDYGRGDEAGTGEAPPDPKVTAFEWALARGNQKFYEAPHGEGWKSVRAGLRGFRDLAQRANFDLKILIFPEEYQVDPERYGNDRPHLAAQTAWSGLCEEYGLECLDLRPAFAEARESDGGRLFGDFQHPDRRGHDVAARAVAEYLSGSPDSSGRRK